MVAITRVPAWRRQMRTRAADEVALALAPARALDTEKERAAKATSGCNGDTGKMTRKKV